MSGHDDWNTGMNDTADWNSGMNLVSTDICDFNLDTVVSADEQDSCNTLTVEWNTTIGNGADSVSVNSSVWADTDGLALQVMDYNLDGQITYTEWLWFKQLMYSWGNMTNAAGVADQDMILSNKYRMFNQNYIFNYTEDIYYSMTQG